MKLIQDEESKVLHKSLQITVVIVAAAWPCLTFAQAPAAQIFVVCGSQQNQPTVYVSAVLQGTKAALPGFQSGFIEFLVQHYGYKGVVGCVPTNTAVNAQNFINTRSTALRNAKKTVVNTGWNPGTPAVAAANAVPPAASTAAAANAVRSTSAAAPSPSGAVRSPSAAAPSPSGAAPNASATNGGASQLTSALGAIFGGGSAGTSAAGSSSGAGCGATSATTATAGKAGASGSTGASGSASAPGNASTGCQSTMVQVSNALANVFKSANGAASSPSAAKNASPSAPAGALGSAQAQNTKIIVYGCGRQDMQVACVSDLANQSQKDTLVQAADVWKDAFIVDDRGDRHLRSTGFFLNIDGDQRPQLDIAYGKTARFILMFDGVQSKVQKVALRSTSGLDVEEIAVIDPNAVVQGSQQH
jgi:hypothetical protein